MEARGLVSIFLVLSLALGCSSAGKRHSTNDSKGSGFYGPLAGPEGIGTEENSFGPQAAPSPTPAPNYGPLLPQTKKIVLVLGPGMARAFSAVGVLKTLKEKNIEIAAIVATELGALIGALYSVSGSLNEFDWQLAKFKPDLFRAPSSFSFNKLLGRKRAESELDEALSKNFSAKRVEDVNLRLQLAVYSENTKHAVMIDSGLIASAVSVALASNENSGLKEWNGQMVRSCSFECAFPVAQAKALGLGPVVVVDSLSQKPYRLEAQDSEYYSGIPKHLRDFEEQWANADLVIRPEMRDMGYFDFSRKSAAIFAGVKATKVLLPKLMELVATESKP